ncbi:hypothetical protein Acr_00g0068270 [Actinidia rufa]|uniref:Uncharacterized protein n=1 Tax=Actinidia rufa TaxID=165716 RepID=A0A7J0DQW8_9ERIC|nr:hypothetical protein Acr_00g0068270 [Actinidia rufa]
MIGQPSKEVVVEDSGVMGGICHLESGSRAIRFRYASKLRGDLSTLELRAVIAEEIIVRAKALVASELSLFSKLGIITALKLGRGAMAADDPEGCQETEGDLHVRVPPDSPHARMETLMKLIETNAPGPNEDLNKEQTLPPQEGRDKRQHKSHGGPLRDVQCQAELRWGLAHETRQPQSGSHNQGFDPPEKFTPPRFTLYDGKSDQVPRESRQANDGSLELYGCPNVPGVPVKLGGPLIKVFVDNEKTRAKKAEVRPNPSFDRGNDEIDRIADDEEDLFLGSNERSTTNKERIGGPRGRQRDLETKVVEDLIRYELDEPRSDHFFITGANLKEQERTELVQFLKANIEELNVLPDARPVKQMGRRSALKNVDAVIEEVEKLKEASAITERMVTKMFEPILGKIMDAYIDDMVVKSKEEPDHIRDLTELFTILKRHVLELNAAKSVFEVSSRKFWRHLMAKRGIEANPEQITTISDLVNPKTMKEVQKLTEMAAALNKFIKQGCLMSAHNGVESSETDLPKPRKCPAILRLNFPTTNNKAEYEAFIAKLQSSSKLKVPELHIFSDSKLVVNQVMGNFEARDAKMAKFLAVAKNLLTKFKAVKIERSDHRSRTNLGFESQGTIGVYFDQHRTRVKMDGPDYYTPVKDHWCIES